MSGFELRCHSCSKFLAVIVEQVRIVALFKPSLVGRMPHSHRAEVRKRCHSCGWVNVFHPHKANADAA